MTDGPRGAPAQRAIAAYGAGRAALTEVLRDVDDATAAATMVPACPAWTVTDAMAHVVGVCIDIVDGAIGADVGTTAWADGHVERHASLGLAGLLDRWQETAEVIDSLGPVIDARAARQFCFDGTTHAHDVRGALGLGGDRSSEGVLVGLDFLAGTLDRLVRTGDVAPLDLVSPDWYHRTDPQGRQGAVRVEASTFELFRSFSGRRSVDQIRSLDWSGDPEPYLAIFSGSPLAPPARPLVE